MRKILALIAGILCVSGMLVSCLENEEIELSSHAYIASFSINDIKTEVLSETAEGKDTTIVYTVKGENYTFAIDHVGGEIYNVDSLPKGTDVTRVTVKLGLDAGYACYYQGEESKIFNAEDSIDFTNPVRFSVFTVDGEGSRNYLIRLNVHQTDVESLVWTKVENNDFHEGRMTAEKMVQLGKKLAVFGEKDGVPMVMAGELMSNFVFSQRECPLSGITGQVNYSSIVTHDEVAYLLTKEGKLYNSTTLVDWFPELTDRTFTSMIGVVDSMLYLNEGGTIVACKLHDWRIINGVQYTYDWQTVQTVDEVLLPVNPSLVRQPLRTNANIVRTVLIGSPHADAGEYVPVWHKFSTDSVWTYYNPVPGNDKTCPLLERLTVIGYDGKLYAFGGASKDGKVEAFEAIYISTDGGITWRKQDKNILLPKELKGYDEPFSCVVDTEDNIWILCSNGLMFRGRIGG